MCFTEQEMQHQVEGVKLAVAMLKDDMFSTRTDLLTLLSPRKWKWDIPAPTPQDSWFVFELPIDSYQFTTLRRRDWLVGGLYEYNAAESGKGLVS